MREEEKVLMVTESCASVGVIGSPVRWHAASSVRGVFIFDVCALTSR